MSTAIVQRCHHSEPTKGARSQTVLGEPTATPPTSRRHRRPRPPQIADLDTRHACEMLESLVAPETEQPPSSPDANLRTRQHFIPLVKCYVSSSQTIDGMCHTLIRRKRFLSTSETLVHQSHRHNQSTLSQIDAPCIGQRLAAAHARPRYRKSFTRLHTGCKVCPGSTLKSTLYQR